MKLFLIDGHALIFRMYYAFLGRPMINSKGVDTSILFGFTKYLLEMVEREHPTHLAVSLDPPGGTFRNEMYPAYKANRGETPQLVIDALEPVTAIVKAMGIPVVMMKGFEADDVIGSMAKRFAGPDCDVYMVTPDKDYGQLVGEHIFQYKPGKGGGENEILGPAEICDKWKISGTAQVIDILTLCGDASDNVPGVQGVGPVGAAKLLARYGNTETIYEHISELTPKQKEMFEAARDHIALSKVLVTIKTDIDVPVTMDGMAIGPLASAELMSLFDLYEFGSLKRKLASIAAAAGQNPGRLEERQAAAIEYRKVAPSEISADEVAINYSGDILYVATTDTVASGTPEDFRSLLENPGIIKDGADVKSQMNRLAALGISLAGRIRDVELMHYLLNPERSHQTDILAKTYLGVELEDSEEPVQASLFCEDSGESEERCLYKTVVLRHLADRIGSDLRADETLLKLYDTIEEPLISVLSRMETVGVKVDVKSLKDYAEGLRVSMREQEALVRELAGEPSLNVSSPKQVGEVVFEKLKLDPKAKKPKSGNWPTDEQTLSELADRSPVIDAILEYRGLRKLLSTYIEPFPSYIRSDGRVHTTFNQALTSTGRLSSSNPNLQNIPIRTEQGREIRKAFVAQGEDKVIMSADYSQIELRIMAHLSADKHLRDAFRSGLDVHSATASKIFGVPVEEVTSDQRRIAKTANFGIMYGISAFGLSQRLKCSRSEARKIIDDYFASFPSIRGFIDDTLSSARENGYVETIFGRRRYVPDVNSHNCTVRAFAERNAVNAPIQGSSADIIKLAMIAVDRRLREEGLKARMVLQIHDELLLEVPGDEIERVKNILVSEMENVVELSVPLTVECNYGNTWLEAH